MLRFYARRLRVRPREAAQIRTTERDVAMVLGTLQGVWRNGTGRQAGGSLRALARQIADDVSDWMASWGTTAQQRQRQQLLRAMRRAAVEWIAPRRQKGRCRRAPAVAALIMVLNAVTILSETLIGKKTGGGRPMD
jgi:hypothetical protein